VPQREDWYVKVILAGILVILIAIGGILVWNRRTQAVMGAAGLPEEEIAPFPEAELVDVGRVTGQDKFLLEKRITKIGRDKSNEISIPEDTVSSFHATIEYMEGFFYVEDQRSTNKTRLEGEIITPYNPRRLKSGDELMFHTHKFTFMLPDQIPSGETEVDFDPTAATVIQEGPRAPEAPPKEVGPLPQAMLVDVSNVTGKKTFKVLKPITKIGRAGSNDLAVPKDTVSGFHATIEFKEGHFYLEDQRSTNKTFLNGEELAPYTAKRLKSGDEIDLDVCKFIFLLERQYPSGETDQRK
jgi:pSer/pThr/pTyr-binding forkhead associated (FHA) protein